MNHQILIQKLHHYGIRGLPLKWFESYLSNRKQCVSIGDTTSDTKTIKCGVPQGSILGPLLFLLYINDIMKSSTLFNYLLFADDTCLSYNYDDSHPETELLLQRELQKISDWLVTNRLTINVDKSNCLISSTGKKKKLSLIMNNKILLEKQLTKYLGVVDNKLTWKERITQTNLRLSEGIGILYKLRRYVPQITLRRLYFSFVQSNVNYCLLN